MVAKVVLIVPMVTEVAAVLVASLLILVIAL